jgi:phage FluMu protein Com
MPANQFHCPSCNTLLRLAEPLPAGTKVKCPKCGSIFGAEETESRPEPVAAAPSPIRPADRMPRPTPRYEEDVYETPPEPSPRRRGVAGLSPGYSIDVGQWFHYATAHYTSVLGPMIGYTLLLGLIIIVLYLLALVLIGIPAALVVLPPLTAGFTVVCLAQLKGKRWSFGDFFSGFNWFGSILGNFLLILLVVIGTYIVCLLPAGVVFGLSRLVHAPAVLVAAIPLYLAGLCGLVYILTRATCFCQQLIIDRGCGPLEAIQGSWALSRGHFWGLFGIQLLLQLINFGGQMACGIGTLFTLPLTLLVWNAGYLLVAGTKPPIEPRAYPHETDYRPGHLDEPADYR